MKRTVDWAITIIDAQNGYIVEFDNELDDGSVRRERILFESKDEDQDGKDALLNALNEVVDFFGKRGSRYDKERLVVTTEPGDKYEPVEAPK